jgi:hypothetical protein
MLKKETHEAPKIAKEKKRKNRTNEGFKVLKKERDSPYFQGNYQKRESHDQRSTKNIRIRKIFYTLAHLDQSV